MIELQHFSIGYKENSLLHEVNATIKKGQLTALIGRNGTGKSTLLRAIAGLNRCYSGKIILDGHDIACMKTDRAHAHRQPAVQGCRSHRPCSLYQLDR